MKAMILCGGQGTRLREFTEVLPKPMVTIGGRPILWHIMKGYIHHGVDEFILCTGYKSGVIKRYFLEYEAINSDFSIEIGKKDSIQLHNSTHDEAGVKVMVVDTGEDAMTGSRVKRASRYLEGDDTFCLTYGDGVADIDLTAEIAFHQSHEGWLTIAGVAPPSRFGEIVLEETKVLAFQEKPAQSASERLINGGFMVVDRKLLDYLSEDDSCVLEREPLERCASDGNIRMFEHKGFWQCMDTHRDWMYLEDLWKRNKAAWKVW